MPGRAGEFEEGISYFRDPQGRRHLHRDDPLCDFCTSPHRLEPLLWEYPAGEMLVVGSEYINASHDEWSACGPCHDLIEANRWESVAARSLTQCELQWGRIKHKTRQEVLRTIRENLRRFRVARTGPARPINWQTHSPEHDTYGPLVPEGVGRWTMSDLQAGNNKRVMVSLLVAMLWLVWRGKRLASGDPPP